MFRFMSDNLDNIKTVVGENVWNGKIPCRYLDRMETKIFLCSVFLLSPLWGYKNYQISYLTFATKLMTVLEKMKWSIWSIITSFMAQGITKLALFYLLEKIIFIKLASNQMQQKFLNRKVQMPQRKRNINIKYACSQRSAAVLVNISFVNPFCVLS